MTRERQRLLEHLWLRRAPALRRELTRTVGAVAAEEIVAEAITRLARLDDLGSEPERVFATTARNLAINHWHREQARPDGTSLEGLGEAGFGPSFLPHRHATLAGDLYDALYELPAVQREAFILTELRGLTVREAAAHLGVSKTTVADRAEAARIYLERTLA